MIKVAHMADLHCSREHQEEAMRSLEFFRESIKKSPVDLVVVAGDTWDASMLNTESSGFMGFVNAIRNIADESPVAMVYGTPSHDTDGSLEVFRTVTARHSIAILDPAQAYLLEDGRITTDDGGPHPNAKAALLGIPEPRRKYLLADAAAGKDDTDEAVRAAMQKLCFLLAAKRRERSALPCVLLYHGDVAGSALQNDMTVERGTGIAITTDDLAGIGADYIALGHIHKPQRVGSLPAYYAGSVYPKNFGETHKAGFNVATVEVGHADVLRVDFPHPQNMKIEARWGDNFGNIDVADRRVWLELTCAKGERAHVDTDGALEKLLALGAADGSRVTVAEDAVEAVRAAEITGASGPAEKCRVWAENSGVELKDSVLKKIASLEAEITRGEAGARGAWELVSVRLRGATGIMKGLRKNEVAVNFDGYGGGLIALVGKNGAGKTTLIENCHPYPQMLTRSGKLQDHFCLRDGFREVVYRDRDSSQFVKCLIQIDGANKSGSCKYFAYRSSDGESWDALPGVDGNLKPYAEFVERTFGPIELFLRTAFTTQRPTKNLPDLTDATAGEKKALFVALAGIDYLQSFSDAAGEKAKECGTSARDAEIRAAMLEDAVGKKDGLEKALADAKTRLDAERGRLSTVEADGRAAREGLEAAQERAGAERERSRREAEAKAEIDGIISRLAELEEERGRNETAAARKEENERLIAEWEECQKTVEAETERRNAASEANAARLSEYLAKKAEFDGRMKVVEKDRAILAAERFAIDGEILSARNGIRLREHDAAEITESCPTCGQRLPAEKIAELEKRRQAALAEIKGMEAAVEKLGGRRSEVEERDAALSRRATAMAFEEPVRPKDEAFDAAVLDGALARQRSIDIAAAKAELDTAKSAAVRAEGINAQIADKTALRRQTEAVVAELSARRDPDAERRLSEARARRDELAELYTACKSSIAALEAEIEGTKRRVADVAAQEKELAEARRAAGAAKDEESEWALVARAFGRDGVQALELDALAPGISDTANRLLESAYGDRFRIDIETTRIGGKGKSARQIEDFKIMVTDGEDGEPTPLENKSGGEAVWIKRAIYDAFAAIRRRNTAFAFLTCFQDEADGALDADAKTAYCRMLEASHDAAKLRHTVVITHSNEVKAMIEQKIDMEEL